MLVEYIDSMGTDLLAVNAARVSYDKWKDKFGTDDERLLEYLAEHEHISPFFHPQICIRVSAPIYVARQLFRHEVGGAKNEVSRRYVDEDPVFEWPTVWRGRPVRGQSKQGSSEPIEFIGQYDSNKIVADLEEKIRSVYRQLLANDVAPEQARVVLPLSLQTKWIWTGSLYFFKRVCDHRLSPDSQVETRDVAIQIDNIARHLFPYTWAALMRREAPTA